MHDAGPQCGYSILVLSVAYFVQVLGYLDVSTLNRQISVGNTNSRRKC